MQDRPTGREARPLGAIGKVVFEDPNVWANCGDEVEVLEGIKDEVLAEPPKLRQSNWL